MSIKSLINKYREQLSYLIVGGLTTLVSFASYFLFNNTFLDPHNAFQLQISNVLSWICAVTFGYVTNRKYVFKSKSNNILSEASKFFGGRVATLLLEMFLIFLFVSVFRWHYSVGKILAQIAVFIANYLISKFFVFKKTKAYEKEIDKKYK